ncbi:protein FAR1-RELATED SEQUENCE 11-like isoform X1 [Rhizophagus irregularis DAOM 181602=DAOM 197198]|nr:protein FAR1-RELATED SEQUENCE 11-like isoform X1 [Rhizophagus irregularis DAOM 181602=DAOM 197198]
MSDSEFMSSDDEIFDEAFDNDFIENIPNDSDSDGEDNGGSSNETLKLEVGMAFLTWKIAFNHIKQWAHQQGFGIRKGRSEKIESKLRKQTIVCFCEGVYNNQSKKTNKPSKTHRTNCKWHVNLSRPTKNNQNSMIFITTIVDEHSGHSLDPCARRFEADKAFTKPMLDDIEWMYVHGHLKPLAIKRMLKAKYKRKVYNKDLYKIIYKYHRNIDQLGNDVSQLFEYLEKCKEDDPRWIIYKDWDRETNTLTKLFWMNPDQLETWYRYNDVILNDNTSKTNRYEMSLSFFVAIDNSMKSRIVAQALMDREIKDAYAWVLQCTIDATGIIPKVFITDADPGMDLAIWLKYSSTFPIHCIWHIGQNLPLRLKSKLGGLFDQFKKDFYECRNSLKQEIFEHRWANLLINYPNAANYLEKFLYPSKCSWARAFSVMIFTIDIQTTSRCESVNATFKNLLQNSNNTLVDIFFTIEERLEEEQDNTDYLNWQNSLTTIQSSTIASNAFTDVINKLKDFTTPSIQKIHNNEMELAFSYDARPLDQSYINNEDSHDLLFANDFIEKQEVRQLSFQQLLLSCDQKEIKSLWGVSYLTSSDTHHLVILLDNGMYKCSSQFHIGFLNPRWFVETSPDLRSRPFCPASKFKMDLVIPYLESNNPPNFLHSINENILNRNNPYVTLSKQKLYYMNIKGLSKQASCVACKTCDESFVTLLEDYITKKNHEALEWAQQRLELQ